MKNQSIKSDNNKVSDASIVKLISSAETLELDETDGKETIAEAKETFPGGIYALINDTNVKSSATEKTQVSVHEMIKDGTFAEIFNGMSNDLNSLCLAQSQIIQFVKKHRKWLRVDGYATFFLFKIGEDFFVASLFFDSHGHLGVYMFRFSDDDVWYTESQHRLVVPQLTFES